MPSPDAASAALRVDGIKTRLVKFEYVADQLDEIALTPGDIVEIDQEFDDGWATGKNKTSGRVGTFPLTCLE